MRAALDSTPERLWMEASLAFGAATLGMVSAVMGLAHPFPSVGPTLALQLHAPSLPSAPL